MWRNWRGIGTFRCGVGTFIFLMLAGCAGPKVTFVEGRDRISVMIGDKPVTAYRFDESLTKPVLYPLHAPSGVAVNRAFPLEHVEGESEDHPHHVGLFFTYDLVNGEGFWNNTTWPPRIVHKKVNRMRGENGKGILSTVSHWTGKDGKVLLEEDRDMVFSGGEQEYVIDFLITLTAVNEQVVFEDTKEGMFAIRVAHWLKEQGGTGRYLSADGNETEANVWGRRAAWVRLEGSHEGRTLGIAILNHPDSVNFPTYWHARGYGLFAANPLGQSVFQKARDMKNPEPYRLTLRPGEEAFFRFRVMIYEGSRTRERLEERYKAFAGS